VGLFAGDEPNQSSGDPAAGVLSEHQPAGEAALRADPGGLPPQ